MHFMPTQTPDALLVEAHIYGDNRRQLWIPPDLIHRLPGSSEKVEIQYKRIDFYSDDLDLADLGVDWPLDGHPLVSAKDEQAVSFRNAECFD